MTKNETESKRIPRDETLHAYEEHLSCGYRSLLDPFDSSFDPTNVSAPHHPRIFKIRDKDTDMHNISSFTAKDNIHCKQPYCHH